jgi:hypothetical protein
MLLGLSRGHFGSFVQSWAGVAAQQGWAMEGKLLVGQRSSPTRGMGVAAGRQIVMRTNPLGLSADYWVRPAARTSAGQTAAMM